MRGLIRKLTQRQIVRLDDRRLVLSRKRKAYLLALVPVAATCAGVLSLCFLRVPGSSMAHAKLLYEIHVCAFTMLPLCVLWLGFGLSRLRSQVWDFDLKKGQVLLDGYLVFPVSEVLSIHMDRDFYNSDIQVLYLRTKMQSKFQIANEGIFGVLEWEMRESGLLISSHLGVALVLKDAYLTSHPAVRSNRWRRKGQYQRGLGVHTRKKLYKKGQGF